MPLKSSVPPAAQPNHQGFFDPWNSSSTGHQIAENRLGASTGWRQSRNTKLAHQFKNGSTGGPRVSDTVGAGSEDWDEKAKALIPKYLRERARNSVRDMLVSNNGTVLQEVRIKGVDDLAQPSEEEKLMAKRKEEDEQEEDEKLNRKKGIFDGLVIYINGSTHPHISDHKLKQILAENGAKLSLHLGRRSVTHVIIGNPIGSSSGTGTGGGLAGSKIEKEIRRVRGCGVKYVGVDWVLESMKRGKRLPEAQFSNLKTAAKSQKSVYNMFKTTSSNEFEASR